MVDETIDTEHVVFDHFRAFGYGPDDLTDPGNMTPSDVDGDEWFVLVWSTNGPYLYDVSNAVEAEWAPAGVAVEQHGYHGGAEQPIAFADEVGLLNAEIRPMSQLQGMSSQTVTFFVPQDTKRTPPEYDEAGAVEALGYWGSEGYIPREAAEAIGAPFGVEFGTIFREDPDAEGVEIARAPIVASSVAAKALGSAKSADSGISGHKKTHRQRFYRNLNALEAEYLPDEEGDSE